MTVKITKLLLSSKKLYKSFGSIYSSALKDNVIFNHYGWRHLRYGGNGHKRTALDIRYRLKLLIYVTEVIKKGKPSSPDEKRFIYVDGIMRTALFKELTHMCKTKSNEKKLVTIVIRKFEIGQPHFYSIRNKRIKKPQ